MSNPWTKLENDEILFGSVRDFEAKALGARWDSTRNCWKLPAAQFHAHQLIDARIDDGSLLDALKTPEAAFEDARLYAAQVNAIQRLIGAHHGAMAVLPPGYGKTATAIIAADQVVPDAEQIVVVVPSPLLYTWQREIAKWGSDTDWPSAVCVIDRKMDDAMMDHAAESRWLVTSWDRVVNDPLVWEPVKRGNKWPLWILDESVLVKSRAAQRRLVFSGGKVKRKGEVVKEFSGLRKVVQKFWLLSGSPSTKYSDDLWTQLNLLWPKAFPSYWRFAERYCVIEETPWSRKVVGDRRDRNAAEENADLIITASETIDLPEYLFEAVDVQLTAKQQKAYDDMQREFIAELGDGTEIVAPNEVTKLIRLQQIASYFDGQSAKHDALVQLLPSFEGPHLIWTHWKEGAGALYERLKDEGVNVAWVSGDDKQKDRDHDIESFKAGKTDALILSLGVGKFGHTLTNAKTIHWVDKTWSADDYFQALHRVRRIGLTHRPVSVTYRAPGTADDLVEMNLEGKLGSISSLTRAELAMLLKGLGK